MHCKLEFTELMKCPQGGYDDPLKERALSNNLSNFEKKMLHFPPFFQNAAHVSFLGVWGWESIDASCLFQSLSLLPGAVLLWAGVFLIPTWGYLLLLEEQEMLIVELGQGLTWGAAPCAEVSAGSSHPLTPIPKPPTALYHVLAVLPVLQLSPLADALSCLCLSPYLMSVQAVWTWRQSVLAKAAFFVCECDSTDSPSSQRASQCRSLPAKEVVEGIFIVPIWNTIWLKIQLILCNI